MDTQGECVNFEFEFFLHFLNPKQVNHVGIEQVKKILYTYSSCWCSSISLKLVCVVARLGFDAA